MRSLFCREWFLVFAVIVSQDVSVPPAAAEGRAGDLAITETARIGVYDEDPAYMFGRVDHAVVAPDHSILVADGQLEQIRRYGANGQFIADIGRKGEGPGEYERVRGMIALPDRRVAILSSPRKLTFLDALSGEYIDAIQIPSGLHADRLLTSDIEGFVYVKAVAEDGFSGDEWQMLWRKIGRDGSVVEDIEIPLSDYRGEVIHSSRPDGMRNNFIEETVSAWSPLGYLVVGRNDRYAFELRKPGGTIEVVRDHEPVLLAPGEREDWKAFIRRMSEQFGKEFTLPEVKPPFFSIEADGHGRIWVHRYVDAVELEFVDDEGEPYTIWREPNSYDVFTPDGEFIGSVTFPMKTRLVARHEDIVWGVQRTDDGEQLVRWKVAGLQARQGGQP